MIKLRFPTNIPTTNKQSKAAARNAMKKLLSYARASKADHSLHSVVVQVRDTKEELVFSNLLGFSSGKAYVLYNVLGNMMIKQEAVLLLHVNLHRHIPVAKTWP